MRAQWPTDSSLCMNVHFGDGYYAKITQPLIGSSR